MQEYRMNFNLNRFYDLKCFARKEKVVKGYVQRKDEKGE